MMLVDKKHIHCWLMLRHRQERSAIDTLAKVCVKCCWCQEPRPRAGEPTKTAMPDGET